MNKETPLNLIPSIRILEQHINDLKSEFYVSITKYQNALDKLIEINEVCLKCAGEGQIPSDIPGVEEINYVQCPDCLGTGRAHVTKKVTE